MSEQFGTLTKRPVHPASPVLLTKNGPLRTSIQVGGQAVLGRQLQTATPWLTERHGYDPTFLLAK